MTKKSAIENETISRFIAIYQNHGIWPLKEFIKKH